MRKTTLLLFMVFLVSPACSSKKNIIFNSQQAFEFLKKQCDFGPRVPGTSAHLKTKDFLVETLKKACDSVWLQEFNYYDSSLNKEISFFNILSHFYPESKVRVLLCAHWDCRPFADKEMDTVLQKLPVLGANDGASGVAVLLEIANVISKTKPKYGVDVVFFDGEDYTLWEELSSKLLGSRYFARHKGNYSPEFAILLDMVGDKDLNIYKERYSSEYAPEIVNLVWKKAGKLNLSGFQNQVKYTIMDDHFNLLQAGIKAVDIIDFDYPYWHTSQDTPDKCSQQSLGQIGKLLIEILYN